MKTVSFLSLLMLLSATGPVAVWAGDREEVATATADWARAFNANDMDSILALYDEEAVLWGTRSPTLRATPEQRREYFARPFDNVKQQKISQLKVELGDSVVRVFGNTAINTGYYTFSWIKNGEIGTLPARFSFTYVRRDGTWKIVDHHSSKIP